MRGRRLSHCKAGIPGSAKTMLSWNIALVGPGTLPRNHGKWLSRWWNDGRERNLQIGGGKNGRQAICTLWSRAEEEPWKQSLFLLLGKSKLHCPSMEPIANTSTSGTMTSSSEKPYHCMSYCDAQSPGRTVPEIHNWLDVFYCVYFSSLTYLIISIVDCGGSSTMR